MPRWLTIALCAFIALVVVWVCVHPNVDLAPTAFRFTAFVAVVMLFLRFYSRFASHTVLSPASFFAIAPRQPVPLDGLAACGGLAPLRC